MVFSPYKNQTHILAFTHRSIYGEELEVKKE